MDRNYVIDAVFKAVEKVTGRKPHELTPQSRLVKDLQLESIDTIDLLFEIEKSIGVSINLTKIFQTERHLTDQKDQFDLELQEIINYVDNLKHE